MVNLAKLKIETKYYNEAIKLLIRAIKVSPIEYKVLIFGSEGSGIRHNILKKCHSTVSIKMKNNVDSLNVSNSAAIVLSRI